MCPQLGMPRIKSDHAHCLGWHGDLWVSQAGTMEGGGSAVGTQRLPLSCQLLHPTPSAAHSPPLSPSRCSLLALAPSLPFPRNCFRCVRRACPACGTGGKIPLEEMEGPLLSSRLRKRTWRGLCVCGMETIAGNGRKRESGAEQNKARLKREPGAV